MPVSNRHIDNLVDRAVREILAEREDGERPNVSAKARELGIPRDRIQRRLKGIGPRTSRKPVNRKLSTVQEASLLRYILSLDEIGRPIRYDQINSAANAILAEDHTTTGPAPSVGHHWVRRFLDRHPELQKAKQKPLVLDKNEEYQAPPPSLNRPPTPSEAQISPPTTPLTAQSLEKQAIQLQNATPSRHPVLQEKFIKGALIQAKTAVQLQRDLGEFTAAAIERKERRSRGQRQLQHGGDV